MAHLLTDPDFDPIFLRNKNDRKKINAESAYKIEIKNIRLEKREDSLVIVINFLQVYL